MRPARAHDAQPKSRSRPPAAASLCSCLLRYVSWSGSSLREAPVQTASRLCNASDPGGTMRESWASRSWRRRRDTHASRCVTSRPRAIVLLCWPLHSKGLGHFASKRRRPAHPTGNTIPDGENRFGPARGTESYRQAAFPEVPTVSRRRRQEVACEALRLGILEESALKR